MLGRAAGDGASAEGCEATTPPKARFGAAVAVQGDKLQRRSALPGLRAELKRDLAPRVEVRGRLR